MAASYSDGPPPRLRARGLKFTKQQWDRLTPEQRRDIVRQSDSLYQRARRAAMPAARRRYNARRRALRYAARPEEKRIGPYRPEGEETDFWSQYQGVAT